VGGPRIGPGRLVNGGFVMILGKEGSGGMLLGRIGARLANPSKLAEAVDENVVVPVRSAALGSGNGGRDGRNAVTTGTTSKPGKDGGCDCCVRSSATDEVA
jgi:hypothetical protein